MQATFNKVSLLLKTKVVTTKMQVQNNVIDTLSIKSCSFVAIRNMQAILAMLAYFKMIFALRSGNLAAILKKNMA